MLSEQQLQTLYNSLSLTEKVGQLLQVSGAEFTADGEVTGIGNSKYTPEELHAAGSVLGIYDGERIRQLQAEHMRHSRIPLLFMGDVTAGYVSAQPMPLAQACSFSPELVRRLARSASEAAASQGLHVTFSPMADVSRDARWGRCAESYGEDVLLSCRMAAAAVTGYQEGTDGAPRLSSCVKHFAAYGAVEAGRDYNNAEVSERTLLSTYLPAYKAAIGAGCDLVMTSFNTIGGVPVTLDRRLCRELLRNTWGFDGVLISDWDALGQCEKHRAVDRPEDVARYGLEASVDIEMAGDHYIRYLPQLVERGMILESLLKEAVMRVLRLKNKKGLLDAPIPDISAISEDNLSRHYALALEAAEKGCVLLENDGILPLKKHAKLALIGPYAVRDRAFMMWNRRSLPEAARYRKLPEAAFRRVMDGPVTAEPGCSLLPRGHFLSKSDLEQDPCYSDPEQYLDRALRDAGQADIVVLMLGEHSEQSGESASRASIRLPELQLELMRKVSTANPNIVTVVFSGRPVEMQELRAHSRALMEAWLGGDAAMEAVANLLSGQAVPSGKLAMSIPYTSGQCPIHYDAYPTCRPGSDRTRKFTTRYLDVPNTPLYPFGYGLSYSDFCYSPISASADTVMDNAPLTLSVSVTNTGNYDAEEVVQLYLRDERASLVSRPERELADFTRVFLHAGETKALLFHITADMLRFYDRDCRLVCESGEYTAYIGGDSAAATQVHFRYTRA